MTTSEMNPPGMCAVSGTRDDQAGDRSAEPKLRPWQRWTTDCNGEPIIGARLGFRERSVGELELRVALGGYDRGVCRVILDERDDEVYVRVLVCWCDDDDDDDETWREYMDCPVRVWLKQPLGDRAVIDVDSDEELPLYIPRYHGNVRQSDHGYHPANRRRRVHRDATTDESR